MFEDDLEVAPKSMSMMTNYLLILLDREAEADARATAGSPDPAESYPESLSAPRPGTMTASCRCAKRPQ